MTVVTTKDVIPQFLDTVNPDGSGIVTRDQWENVFAVLSCDCCGVAVSRKAWHQKQGHSEFFDQLPKKNKAAISLKEWMHAFDMFDLDQDHRISKVDIEIASDKTANLNPFDLNQKASTLKATGTKQGCTVDPMVVEIYGKLYLENGGDKAKVCAALGLLDDGWSDKCSTKDGFITHFLGVARKSDKVALSAADLAAKVAALKATQTKENSSAMDPAVVKVYKAIYSNFSGEKVMVCTALGLDEKDWSDKCNSVDGFVAHYLGVNMERTLMMTSLWPLPLPTRSQKTQLLKELALVTMPLKSLMKKCSVILEMDEGPFQRSP